MTEKEIRDARLAAFRDAKRDEKKDRLATQYEDERVQCSDWFMGSYFPAKGR